MWIGVPKETRRHEHRVGLSPSAVARLAERGHDIVIEQGAGAGAHFPDAAYEAAGARIVYRPEEVFGRAELVCRIGPMADEELEWLRPRAIVCGFQHLVVGRRSTVERLLELEATVVAWEMVTDADGSLPVLVPFSEMAGRMAVHLAAQLLQTEEGGRGILLGNVPGVPPPTVLILGAGTAGRAAAAQAVSAGAHVIVFDADPRQIRRTHEALGGQVHTAQTGLDRLERLTAITDVVIGAVLVPGARTPWVLTEEMVRGMRKGSVIVDLSIDQGGCVATSRPTDLASPTYEVEGVVHHCVPNLTANVPRTASRAFANAAMPYLTALTSEGLASAIRTESGLAAGVCLHRGRVVSEPVAGALGLDWTPLDSVADGEGDER